jgi:phosphodiesterase/alkaline phosphatase D-like protein
VRHENTSVCRLDHYLFCGRAGSVLHYGIVHYGTDAKNLSELAKSPNRRNPSRPDMIFRVRIAGLKPQTTYYYTVESTSATGVNDGVSSPIRTFKTR